MIESEVRIVRGTIPPDEMTPYEIICYEPTGVDVGVWPHYRANYVPPVPSFVERRAQIMKECAAENARLEKAKKKKEEK